MLWHFYRLNYFYYTFSFGIERHFRSCDAVASNSCDWSWHSGGSLIPGKFDLKINWSMKTPWQGYIVVACSYSSAPGHTYPQNIGHKLTKQCHTSLIDLFMYLCSFFFVRSLLTYLDWSILRWRFSKMSHNAPPCQALRESQTYPLQKATTTVRKKKHSVKETEDAVSHLQFLS